MANNLNTTDVHALFDGKDFEHLCTHRLLNLASDKQPLGICYLNIDFSDLSFKGIDLKMRLFLQLKCEFKKLEYF